MTPGEEDDLLLALGVSLDLGFKKPKAPVECGQRPPKAKAERHTAWNNLAAFTFTGYVAKVTRCHCQTCDNLFDLVEGIFIEETHGPSGTRRLQVMTKGAQWPMDGGHRKEVEDREVSICGECVGALGFDREVDARGQPYALKINE